MHELEQLEGKPPRAEIPDFVLVSSPEEAPSREDFLIAELQRRFNGRAVGVKRAVSAESGFVLREPVAESDWKLHVLPKPVEDGDGVVVLGDGSGESQEQARALLGLGSMLEERNREQIAALLGSASGLEQGGQWKDAKKIRRKARRLGAWLKEKAQRLACCGRFGRISRAVGCGRRGWDSFNCGLRTCQRCAPLIARKLFEKLQVLEKVVVSRPGWTLALLDFTLQNSGSLPDAELIREGNRAVHRTMERLLRGVKGWGYLWIDELGFDNTNLHMHGIYYGPYLNKHETSGVWSEENGGSSVTWIQKVRRGFRPALWHHLKYVSKPPSNDPQRLAEIEAAFSGVRKVHTMGAFYDLGDVSEKDIERDSGTRECPCGCGPLVLESGYLPVSQLVAEQIRSWDDIRREVALTRVGSDDRPSP